MVAGRRCQSGSPRTTAAIVSGTSSPSNARAPASSSNSTQPNAQMSERLSAGRPFACSGAMYAAVPRMTLTPVIIAPRAGDVIVGELVTSFDGPCGSIALARPKSSTFTVPPLVSAMLAGFRSR